ncbi:MAG: sporulation protein YqfD [Christensenellales bacterium]
MKRKRNNLNIIRCTSLNLSNFINLCTTNGMSLNLISRTSDGFAEFGVNDKDLHILSKLDTSKYDIEIIKVGGIKKFFNTIIYRIGLVVGLVISIIAMFLLNNRLFRIHIYGLSNIEEEKVIESINDFGINIFSSLDFDKTELENYLSKEFNFSMVSIISKGNSLIISIKEELPDISDSYAPITADFNMVIGSINVYSGTSKVKSGDIVYKGDTIVEPFIKSGDDIVYITPCADIKAKAYFSASYNFQNTEEVLIRTGNKKIISNETYLGKYLITKNNKENPYQNFELENTSKCVSQYFLPIKIYNIFAYELTNKVIEHNFESEKEEIINKVKSEAYSLVPKSLKVDNEELVITDTTLGKIVNVYLECNVEINYKYN